MPIQFSGKIKNKVKIANKTWEITISHSEDNFTFRPGQYVWIIDKNLSGEKNVVDRRAFSVVSTPNEKNIIKIVLNEGLSKYKNNILKSKSDYEVEIYGPFGSLVFDNPGKLNVFISNGVAIAPYLSVIKHMSEVNIGQKIVLFWFNRSSVDEFYLKELEEILKNKKNIKIFRKDWDGEKIAEIGEIDEIIKEINKDSIQWFLTGNQIFVNEVTNILFNLGIDNIWFEENYPLASGFEYITYQKLIDSKLNYFKVAVDNMSNHLIFTDIDGKIVYANKAAEEMTGFTFEEMKGQTPRLWGGLMDKSLYDDLWKTIKIDKKPYKGEIINHKKNGELYTTIASISPIIGENGILYGFIGIEEDISERVKSRNELERKTVDFQKLNSLMIGRELRIAELKTKIKKLEKEK